MRSRGILSVLSAALLVSFLWMAASDAGLASQGGQAPPAKPPAKTTPAKTSPAKQPAPEAKAPAAPRIPGPPPAPAKLEFSSQSLALADGDRWSYLVTSTDPALDGKTLHVTLRSKDEKKAVFAVQLGEGEAATADLNAEDATWFAPREGEKGFHLLGIGDEYPPSVERGVRWSKTNRFFSYDNYGRPTGTTGYVISASGPEMCVVACGTFPCTELRRTNLSGPVERQIWLAPEVPAALRAKLRRPGEGKGWMLLDLLSFEAAGKSGQAAGAALPAPERQKAMDWIKANNKFGPDSDLVVDVIHLLQEGARRHPGAGIKLALGSGLAKDGKGYTLEWRAGKFTAREMTAEEAAAASAMSLTRTVVP